MSITFDSVHAYTKGRYILIFVSTHLNVNAYSQILNGISENLSMYQFQIYIQWEHLK